LQPWYVLTRYPNRLTKSIFAFVNGSVAIGIMSLAHVATQQPLIFPSLGPTAFLFFFRPSAPSSAPRNAILAHGSGVLVGLVCYWVFAWVFGSGTAAAQVAAAAVSLGTISALMIAADFPHAPAASTTLIMSLGLMSRWQEAVAIMVAVLMLVAQAWLINRLSGVYFPIWKGSLNDETKGLVAAALKTSVASPREENYAAIADKLVARSAVAPSRPIGRCSR
jgi:CBS-domain-containing membrane protein